MSAEIALVQEIEKHPCLYNSYLPEYNRKDLTEDAWGQVAHNNNLTSTYLTHNCLYRVTDKAYNTFLE